MGLFLFLKPSLHLILFSFLEFKLFYSLKKGGILSKGQKKYFNLLTQLLFV